MKNTLVITESITGIKPEPSSVFIIKPEPDVNGIKPVIACVQAIKPGI